MVALNDIKARRDEIIRICESHGGHNVRVFGSVVRGEENPDSDLDLLINMETGRSLLDLVAIKLDLEDTFHQTVDVVTESALHRLIRDQILSEAVPL